MKAGMPTEGRLRVKFYIAKFAKYIYLEKL